MVRKLPFAIASARVISVVFHPLLMPTWVFIAMALMGALATGMSESNQLLFYGLAVFGLTFVMPVLVFMSMLRVGKISSLQMPQRDERQLPIMLTAVFFYGLFYWSKGWSVEPLFKVYILGAALLSLIAFLINYRWKISLHMLGTGGLTGCMATYVYFMSPEYFPALPVAVLVAGLTAFARLKLSSHTQGEVYFGFLLGFGLIFSLFVLITV